MTTDQLLAVGVFCNAVAFVLHGVWHLLDGRVTKRAVRHDGADDGS